MTEFIDENKVSEYFRKYNLRPYSLEALEGYFRYLCFTEAGSRTLPYHFLIVDQKEKEYGIRFVKDFSDCILKMFHEKRRIWRISEKELLEKRENIFRSLGDTDILVISDCEKDSTTDEEKKAWTEVSEIFDRHPSVVKFLVSERDVIEFRFRPMEQVYYRTFRNHIETRLLQTTEDILYWLGEELAERYYTLTEEFKSEISLYVETVYPGAQLKEQKFLDDLIYRIETEYYKKSRENSRILTGGHVPFYKKGIVSPDYPLTFGKTNVSPISDVSSRIVEEKNVLILSMSTLPFLKEGEPPKTNKYWARIPEAGNGYAFFRGVSQLEAGTKYWITRFAASGRSLDKIIVYATKEALEKINSYGVRSAVDVYSQDILEFVVGEKRETVLSDKAGREPHVSSLTKEEKEHAERKDNMHQCIEDVSIVDTKTLVSGLWNGQSPDQSWIAVIDESVTEGSDTPEIERLNKLYAEVTGTVSPDRQDTKLNLYLDAQGGERTFFNLIFSLLSLQNPDRMDIKGVSAVRFDRKNPIHQVLDVTEEFQTIKMVSAVKAFSQYGRGELLTAYQGTSGRYFNDRLSRELLPAIQQVAEAISISNPSDFDEGIEKLKEILKDKEEDRLAAAVSEDKSSPYYFLAREIWDKYRRLLSGERNALTTVCWCYDNQFYQQALSFIEDKMPSYILSRLLHISYKEVTDGDQDRWHRIDLIRQEAPDYGQACQAVEKITGESRFYVSREGSFLYQCFSSLKGNMDQLYAEMVCCRILEETLKGKKGKYPEIGARLLTVSSSKRKVFAGRLFRGYMDALSSGKGKKISLQDLYTMAARQGQPLQNLKSGWKKQIDQNFVNSWNDAAAPADTVNNIKKIFLTLNRGEESSIKKSSTFDGVCGGLAGLLISPDGKKYFPDAEKDILSMLFLVLTKEDQTDRSLVSEICAILGCGQDFNDLRECCYGQWAARMQVSCSQDDEDVRREMQELKDAVNRVCGLDPSGADAYIRYHGIVDKLEKNSGNYQSAYGSYEAVVKMREEFPDIHHQADHWYTVLGAASQIDNKDFFDPMTRMTDNKAGCIGVCRNGEVIEIEYGPFSGDGRTWNILCRVPAADKEKLKRLDLFLGLHGALKQERNVCNHASDSSLRLSVSHIRSMLERYIQMEKDLEKLPCT